MRGAAVGIVLDLDHLRRAACVLQRDRDEVLRLVRKCGVGRVLIDGPRVTQVGAPLEVSKIRVYLPLAAKSADAEANRFRAGRGAGA